MSFRPRDKTWQTVRLSLALSSKKKEEEWSICEPDGDLADAANAHVTTAMVFSKVEVTLDTSQAPQAPCADNHDRVMCALGDHP